MREGLRCGCVATICALLLLSGVSSACAKSIINARIVDAENGQPIKDVIVAYRWYKEKLVVPGLPTEDITVEAGEEISDDDGTVRIPKYSTLLNDFRIVAYKRGYVCWSNLKIFPTWEKRENFSLEEGIILRLDRFKDDYSREKHVNFFGSMRTGLTKGSRLMEALRQERILLHTMQGGTK